MSDASVENVLVVPTQLFHKLGYFQGFCGEVDRYLPELLSPQNTTYRPRNQVETDPGLKQLIPYVIFCHRDDSGCRHVFRYTRGTGQGEGRLHRKHSVGIGGHISSSDACGNGCPYAEGMRRELDEEVAIDAPFTDRRVGLINDDETEVGKVHLGVVHLFEVDRPAVRPRETEIVECAFRPVEEILANLDGFESWSQICMRAIFGNSPAGAKG
ncbi:MAG: phosphoesterase [Thermoguttaceae bacterium]